jgi:hypothetical protein
MHVNPEEVVTQPEPEAAPVVSALIARVDLGTICQPPGAITGKGNDNAVRSKGERQTDAGARRRDRLEV